MVRYDDIIDIYQRGYKGTYHIYHRVKMKPGSVYLLTLGGGEWDGLSKFKAPFSSDLKSHLVIPTYSRTLLCI